MRIVVTGCRRWYIPDVAESVVARFLARYGPGIVIVHGDCEGVDRSFREACEELGVRHEPHPARWDDIHVHGALIRHRRDGKPYAANAGPLRNAEMLAAGADLVVAFHRNLAGSRGTGDCARQAIALGIPTYLCDDETATPRRLHDAPR